MQDSMESKIVSVSQQPYQNTYEKGICVIALCEDGTIWRRYVCRMMLKHYEWQDVIDAPWERMSGPRDNVTT